MTDRLHPGAWWLWALALAAAASHTTNPLLLGLIVAVAALMVAARRTAASWAVGFRWYLVIAAAVVLTRVLFRILTAGSGPTVVFTLPRIELPAAAAGITLLGPVSAEALTAGFYDGLRLATLIVCVGAANALANPKRLLAAVPAALYEAGTVLVVSVSVFPQLAESVIRVRRARALRGRPAGRRHVLRGIVVPVLTDALDRSLQLASSMDSRGYGRVTGTSKERRAQAMLLLGGLVGIAVGCYALLDATSPGYLSASALVFGACLSFSGLRLAGRRVRRTRYRPETWGTAEWLLVTAGLVTAVAVFSGDIAGLYPSANPLGWPPLPLIPAVGVLIAGLPAWAPSRQRAVAR